MNSEVHGQFVRVIDVEAAPVVEAQMIGDNPKMMARTRYYGKVGSTSIGCTTLGPPPSNTMASASTTAEAKPGGHQ